jgi:hypothetical protein
MLMMVFVLGAFLSVGCSDANEEALSGPTPVAPPKPGVPQLKGYADAVKYTEEQQRAKAAEAKSAPKQP